ncbi:MAG: hypothetical protein MI922_20780, partial [Bacteroidales bacterium]|nr:hypothetical protein [Bacteroidales bacterium]
GHVTLVVIPDISNENAINKLEPKVSLNTITEIEKFITKLAGFFNEIHVVNPDYESIKFEFEVEFHSGYEFGYYKQKLNEDLINFLSPWAFSNDAEISFGGRFHKSTFIKFIEDLSYVDYVSNFKMFHFTDCNSTEKDTEEIIASNSKSILVSAESHKIDPITVTCT